MSRTLQPCLVILLALLFISAQADEAADREAILVEIEQLRYTGSLSVGEVDVASGELLAEVYERRGFEPAWSGIHRLVSLIELVRATAADGLDPEDYHLSDLERVHGMLINGRVLNAVERAALDIAMTDSLIRLGYHQRFGKVNPYDLDPTWNFSRDLQGRNPAKVIQEAFEAESLTEFRDTVFPRAELYRALQAKLAEYRDEGTGEIVVADYKTDRVGDDAEIEIRASIYQTQLEIYASALQQAMSLDVTPRQELWFVGSGVIHRLGKN